MHRTKNSSRREWSAPPLALALLLAIATVFSGAPVWATAPPPESEQEQEEGLSPQDLAAASLAFGAIGTAVGVMSPASESSRALRATTSLVLGGIGLTLVISSRMTRNGVQDELVPYLATLSNVSAMLLGLAMRHREVRPHMLSAAFAPYPSGGLGVAVHARF